ncbi:hypothetical protein DPMN_089646 [Dreissena polymorpha]|uniref:Uncharacterized protein n=1 Tax=Dreissena polymorpha TaxID=45954 RepID=A0A9D4KWS3_DREPO|nr:hypothetical protein DPMN_089646 [Dreissena polymorpha]
MWTDGQRTKTTPKTLFEQSKTLPHPPGSHFHDDWAKNVTTRVFTSFFLLYKYKTTAPPGSNVIQRTGIIFQLNSRIKETNVVTKFHKHWAENVTFKKKCPAHWRPCFFTDMDHFELVRHINKTNILINFHDDWANIVTSRVFTRKTAPPTGGHLHEDWALNVTSTWPNFIGTNLLIKFHKDQTINVASRVFTNKCGRTDDGQRPATKAYLINQVS